MSRDVLGRLADNSIVAMRIAGDAWPRSLLKETPIPAGWLCLVASPDDRRRLVHANDEPRAERADTLILVRDRAVDVQVAVDEIPASGGNDVSADCCVRLSWRLDEHELAALARSLLDEESLPFDRLQARFTADGARAALQNFIREHSAAELVQNDQSDALLAALREAMKRFTFETGAAIERIASVTFTSETFERRQALEREAARRMQQIESRKMVEQAALAATQARLDDLKGVLGKLKAAAGDDDRRWHELLPALSPSERGRLLENLWRLTPNRRSANAIIAIAGSECLWLDPAEPERISQRVTLADDLGGLRSVAFDPSRNQLLVGAASGVWLLDAATGEPRGKYEVPSIDPPRTGFNEAIVLADRLYATHSGLGCWSWSLDDPTDAKPVFEPTNGVPRTVRDATASDDGRVFFAADAKVWFYDPQTDETVELASIGDTIHSLAIIDNHMFVGSSDGKLLRSAIDAPGRWTTLHRSADRIESIVPRRWNDLVELVVPSGDDGIIGIYGDENVVVRLLDSRVVIRRAWACDDAIVGLSAARNRLLVMNANSPERTACDVPIRRLVGHSVQDACIVTVGASSNADGDTVSQV